MLEAKDLDVGYDGVQVIWNANLRVEKESIVALIGPNGAGKSTLLKTIIGVLDPIKGELHYNGKNITKVSVSKRVKDGISLVPEGRRLFQGLTIEENLLVGCHLRKDKGEIPRDFNWIFEIFPILKERRKQLAGTLSGGEQQMCAIARGLMSRPKLFLIDEFSLGLAPVVVDELLKVIEKISKEGITILLVEQDVHLALELADYGYLFETGHIVKEGEAQSLLRDDHIKKAYLGI